MSAKTDLNPDLNINDLPYRPCVGMMVLNKDGLVWVGKRIMKADSPLLNPSFPWQMPQGGINNEECPQNASLRELYEETGIRSVTLLAESTNWLTYDLPKELLGIGLKGKYRGQKQKWFAYKFDGNETEIQINPPVTGEKAEFECWKWEKMDLLPLIVIPFKRKLYKQVIAEFSHLATP